MGAGAGGWHLSDTRDAPSPCEGESGTTPITPPSKTTVLIDVSKYELIHSIIAASSADLR